MPGIRLSNAECATILCVDLASILSNTPFTQTHTHAFFLLFFLRGVRTSTSTFATGVLPGLGLKPPGLGLPPG
jgi:hypothetical protein